MTVEIRMIEDKNSWDRYIQTNYQLKKDIEFNWEKLKILEERINKVYEDLGFV